VPADENEIPLTPQRPAHSATRPTLAGDMEGDAHRTALGDAAVLPPRRPSTEPPEEPPPKEVAFRV
jgi:hypothetical protein